MQRPKGRETHDAMDNLPLRRWQRNVRLMSYVVTAAAAYHCVFNADFGPGEHVFTDVRRWRDRKLAALWGIGGASDADAAKGAETPSRGD